jgi:hypothetical protein
MNISNAGILPLGASPDMPANRPFQMRAPDDWWRDIDDWRRLQPDLPTRAEAIRRLVAKGLKADPPTQRLTAIKVPKRPAK